MSTLTTTNTQQLPAWYNQYAQNLVGRAMSVTSEPYQQYGAARVAGFTPDQQQAFQMTRDNIGAGQGLVNQAATNIGRAGNVNAAGAAAADLTAGTRGVMSGIQPFINAATNASAIGAARPFMQQAGGSALGDARSFFNAAARGSGASAASPFVQAAQGSSLNAAMPMLQAGLGSFTQNYRDYMNPYTDAVVDRVGVLAGRNLRENILPSVNRTFVGGGTFGGSRSAEFNARAIRDANESALAQQADLLRQGYGQAADIFGQEMGRNIQAGTAAGNLAAGDLGRQAELGRLMGSLTADDLGRQLQIGQATGALSQADKARAADLARTAGNLTSEDANRQIQAGQLSANVANAERDRAIRAAQIRGDLTAADANRMLSSGQALANVGEQTQRMRAADTAALAGIGQQQQNLRQTSANLAYEDFQRQRDYPWQQVERLANIGNSIRLPSVTQTQTPGPNQTAQTIGSVGSILSGIGSILFPNAGRG